ncbi:hypothetical protein BDN70DRAFT_932948 [Pholiota conissans]|uniref:FAD-binding FR-type domain-containing protein n=1 Tax=Pholiota conissans TaxID=109636 RepID=A0A9P5Z015_9AGAR|nr:hypothetical protein BDN70DRAFT_932948 [Pholiota conissans]
MASPAPVDPNKAIRIARFFSYPKQELYLLASFIFLVSLAHYLSLLHRYLSRNRPHATRPTSNAIRWRRLPLAATDTLRAMAFRWTVPLGLGYTLNLAELGLTVGYIGVLFSWTFVNTTNLEGMLVDPKYYANRAGTIAASQLPIMAALGMRNNLFSYLTGVSFDKLNYLHRVSARVICVLAWIHGGGRITVGLTDDETIDHRWVQCGLLAASTLTLLCILSVRPARERAYEFFLAVHLLFALMFMLAILFHLTGRTKTYYGAWPAFIVWGIDRAIRLIQLLLYNRGYFLSTKPTSETLDARLTLLTPHFLRISLRRPSIHWRAGQSAFLSFPSLGGGWAFESHPFTIATLDDSSKDDKELVFILRVRKGLTQRLALAAGNPNSDKLEGAQRVYISGPTSSPPLLVGYQRIALIAGGSGAAFTLPLLLDVIRRARTGDTGCQHVLFIWAIRDIENISWISTILTPFLCSPSLPPSLGLKILFYITSSSSTPSDSEESSISGDVDVEKWAEVETPVTSPSPVLSKSPSGSGSVEGEGEGESSNSDKSNGKEKVVAGKGPDAASASTATLLTHPAVRVLRGRPDMAALLGDEIGAATGRADFFLCFFLSSFHSIACFVLHVPGNLLNRSLSTYLNSSHLNSPNSTYDNSVCGTHSLAESVRLALRTPRPMDILRGGPSVTLHVEAFGGN